MECRRVVIGVVAILVIAVLGQTWAQLSRMRGIPTIRGGSEMPCGPRVPDPQPMYPIDYRQSPLQPPLRIGPSLSPGAPPPPGGPPPRGPSPPQGPLRPQPRAPPAQWNTGRSPSYQPGFSPYHAAMLDMDYPFFFLGAGGMFPGFPGFAGQQQFHRIAKRQIMPAMMMNCQCDHHADCNMQATMIGMAYNHQCERRLNLICCCRGGAP